MSSAQLLPLLMRRVSARNRGRRREGREVVLHRRRDGLRVHFRVGPSVRARARRHPAVHFCGDRQQNPRGVMMATMLATVLLA